MRMLENSIAKSLSGPSPSTVSQTPNAGPVLAVDTEGRWFRVSGRPTVDLMRRRPLRLLCKAFVEERIRAPGTPLPVELLVSKGWPDEKLGTETGLSRLYVAIATLRKLGLHGAIITSGDGYLFDPRIRMEPVDSP
jgi:hypothetical protein